jgi:5-formyltetrahydrofolate cyclo-ligase
LNKKELRQELRTRLGKLTPEEIAAQSRLACNLLCEQPEYKSAEVVMLFLSMPQEVDTAPLAQAAWGNYKSVLAPRVSWEQRRMLPIEIKSLHSDIQEGTLGIRQPIDGMPVPVSDIDLVVVPGLGFDYSGNRLGRGRGFYDRFLSHRDFRGVACGVAFETQVLPEVPYDETDQLMDMLVTNESVRRFTTTRTME